jgi:hypothetical protein
MNAPRIPRYRIPVIPLGRPRWYESELLRRVLIGAIFLAAVGLYRWVEA